MATSPPRPHGSVRRLTAAGFMASSSTEPTIPDAESEAQRCKAALENEKRVKSQAKAAMKDGASKILCIGTESFDDKAASAFGVFKGALKLISELPESSANTLLAAVDEKREVLEFLCKLAKEKRMYCKQIQFALDILLKCDLWQEVWQESADLRACVPPNLRTNYDGSEVSSAERLAQEAHAEFLALEAATAALAVDREQTGEGLVVQPLSPLASGPSSSGDAYEKPLLPAEEQSNENKVLIFPAPAAGDAQHVTELAAVAPRPRKRDKVKSVFARALFCFERPVPLADNQ